MLLIYHTHFSNSSHSPPQPAGLRTCDGAAFASFEKYAAHFSNHAFGMTEPKEAPYPGTCENAKTEPEILCWSSITSENEKQLAPIFTSICRVASFALVRPKADRFDGAAISNPKSECSPANGGGYELINAIAFKRGKLSR